MKLVNKFFSAGAVVTALLFSGQAMAATISCPDPLVAPDTRQVVLTNAVGSISCFFTGQGNDWNGYTGTEPTKLFKSDETGNPLTAFPGTFVPASGDGANSGSFSFTVPSLGDYFLTMKFGQGSGNPDWVAFKVSGTVSADWAFLPTSLANNLSHFGLWGPEFDPPGDEEVPEPGTLALMGFGLLGLGYRFRRRKTV